VGSLVCIENGVGGLGLHGLGVNVVGVIGVEDEELGVALTGWEDESPGLVSEDLAG
jgi:hypothetical protein